MNEKTINILLVEDNASDARLVQEILLDATLTIKITHCKQLSSIIAPINEKQYDLILLDLNLPDSNGLNTIVKLQEILPNIPMIVLTGLDDYEISLASIRTGAQDYLVKNQIDSYKLQKTIQYAIYRFQAVKKINEASEKQQAYLNSHDVLTGFANQQLFVEHLELSINKHEITKKAFALVLLELHETKQLIDNFGHFGKDLIFKKVADNLQLSLETSVFFARYSDNTFALLFTDMPDIKIFEKYLADMQQILALPIAIHNQEYFPSYNMGISIYPLDGDEAEFMIKNAQIALKKATDNGIKKYEIYNKKLDLYTKATKHTIWHSDLQFALEREEFFLLYQPQLDVVEKKIRGVEALLRWSHPKFGIIPPANFIPVAEDSNYILPIGAWVLENVAAQYRAWQEHINQPLALRLHVNISVCQLHNNLVETIENILKKYQIAPELLEIELTESAFITQPDTIIEKLNQLKKLGVRIAIDNFGRGYSSLSYLSHLPIDQIKLDIDFVQKNDRDTSSYEAVKSVIDLAHNLNLTTIAEGVESKKQLELLQDQNCDEVQGYYFSKPVSARDIFVMMKSKI